VKGWKALSIRSKLTALIFAGMIVPLALGIFVIARQDIRALRQELAAREVLVASLAASYGAADIAFEDKEEAQKTLATLVAVPEVVSAALYNSKGERFAVYRKPGLPQDSWVPARLEGLLPPHIEQHEDSFDVYEPVIYDMTRYGTLLIRSSLGPLGARIRAYLWGVLLAVLGAVAFSLAFALALQRLITRPVLGLAAVARRIAAKEDYTVRAPRLSSDELGLLADAFNTMLAEVERRQREALEAIRVREEFLSVASHELKTPLTSLNLALESLRRLSQRGLLAADPVQVGRTLGMMGRGIDRLDGLIGSLLDVARLTRGKIQLELEEVDLAGIARGAVELNAGALAQAGCSVQLSAAGPVVGRWDRLRLEQVVTNLLSNAMKYGAGKPIEVVVEENGERALLAVRDYGLGISEAEQKRIFGAFERAVSDRHYGGLGLGLYIARQIVMAHGGSIRVESKPGLGSTFTVELSLNGPAPLPEGTEAVLGPTQGQAGIDRP
jgi:signal transduction histidine kinase